MLGWAIQKGHRIEWSSGHQNYMPSIIGTPQETSEVAEMERTS